MLYYYVKINFGNVLQKKLDSCNSENSRFSHIENNTNLRLYDRGFSPLLTVGTEY